jgi:sugar lactone lactonase YvrE
MCLRAQTAADSARVARSSWSTAVAAFRNHDVPGARAAVERASASWPTQQAYVWNRALLSAALQDTGGVQRALEDYANLGLGRDLRADTTFDRFETLPWFGALAARHDANRAVIARSRVLATLEDSTLWPESVDYDPRSGKLYVTSVRHRTIVERARDGKERDLWKKDSSVFGAVMAVRVDPKGGTLWATLAAVPQMAGYSPKDSAIAALVEVRISDGAILRRFDLPPSSRHTLGDVSIGPRGDVFVTDSDTPALYRLRPGADSLDAITHPLFRSLQGSAPAPDGNTLFIADYSHGLLRVDLRDDSVTRLRDAPHSTSLGCDGIILHENAIIAVQNGVAPARIMRFDLDREGRTIVRADVLDRNWTVADEPTNGTIIDGEFVYVANSQWEKFESDGRVKQNVRLARPVLLALPLRR